MLVQTPLYETGPLVYGDYGEGEGWYQELTTIEFDPISGLGGPWSFKKVFKKVAKAVKKVVKPVAHVVGGVLRIAAPVMGLIPGIGIPLAMGATLAGKMMQRDKPFQVFKQKATLFQVGAAGLAAYGVSQLTGGLTAANAAKAALSSGSLSKAVPTAEILRGGSGYEQIPAETADTASMGDALGMIGRTAVAGLKIYGQAQQILGGSAPVAEVSREQAYTPGEGYPGGTYLPGAPYSYLQPDFPGLESRVEGGVPAGSGAMMFPETESEVATASAGLPIPLLLGAGALLFFLAPSPRRR